MDLQQFIAAVINDAEKIYPGSHRNREKQAYAIGCLYGWFAARGVYYSTDFLIEKIEIAILERQYLKQHEEVMGGHSE